MRIHIVQKGDTLWKIAKKYGVNFEELKKANSHISNPDLIMPGMKIKVPTMAGSVKKKEMPIGVKEIPKSKPLPVVKAPKEKPKAPKEVPVIPYQPIVPQPPPVSEIDVNNYYMVNMANMSMQQQAQHAPPPYVPPQPPPVVMKEESPEAPPIIQPPQGECYQPMMHYCPTCCTPVTPVMPGSGFNFPMTNPVQPMPAMMYPQQMVNPQMMPAATMPTQPMPGMVGGSMMMDESSSSLFEMDAQIPVSPFTTMPMGQQMSYQPGPMMAGTTQGTYGSPTYVPNPQMGGMMPVGPQMGGTMPPVSQTGGFTPGMMPMGPQMGGAMPPAYQMRGYPPEAMPIYPQMGGYLPGMARSEQDIEESSEYDR